MSIEDFKQLQAELKAIIQHLQSVNRIVVTKTDSLAQIEGILKVLPSGDTIARAIDEWRQKVQSYVNRVKQERKEAFSRILAEFIRVEQAKNINTREFDNSWRIGPLQIQLRREQSQIQIAYNQEVIVRWSSVAQSEDIRKLYENAMQKLHTVTVPLSTLTEVFWNAYEYIKWDQSRKKYPHPDLVPLKTFYYETGLSMIRKSRGENMSLPKDFPLWAFLYNLDIYREKSSEIPLNKRLGLQTGSQAESGKIGVVINGLDARQDYKIYCFIYAVEG